MQRLKAATRMERPSTSAGGQSCSPSLGDEEIKGENAPKASQFGTLRKVDIATPLTDAVLDSAATSTMYTTQSGIAVGSFA